MNRMRVAMALGAMLACGAGLWQYQARHDAEAELRAARERRAALASRIAEIDVKVRQAERGAREAERDTGELLKAVAAVTHTPAPPSPPGTGASPTRMTVVARDDSERTPEEQERLAIERAYQQDLAKRRQRDVMSRAKIAEDASKADAATAFRLRFEEVRKLVDQAQFQAAQRLWNEMMAAKPPELALPDEAEALRATLQAQNQPVEVTFVSDEQTFVAIGGVRHLGRLQQTAFKLMPGDYEVRGRRTGYKDYTLLLVVRSGVAPPVVTVICTQPDAK